MGDVVPPQDLAAMVGSELPPSPWLAIDQPRIDAFAEVTEDHQFIHVDPARAAQTPFGSTIAHGFLTLSLLTPLLEDAMPLVEGAAMTINYGFDRVRFIAPVKVGSRIRARATIAEVTERTPGQHLVRYDVTVDIEGEERPALRAEWLAMTITR
jgi:acyl dehydratase